MMKRKKAALRCGRCWRDLSTRWGQAMHTVFQDGSMRCYSQEGATGVGSLHEHVELKYTRTHVVEDTKSRRKRLPKVVNHG